ncbi:MAG: RluA family pseudouridine synthase [Actinomycetota bacterium]|nr:RluA family pseudouridine synthase [Actinomycetota bacterium]
MSTLRFHAPEADRLDRALAGRPEVGSRALAERLIAEGAVTVDGAARSKSYRLEGGEEVVAELPAAAAPLAAEEMNLRVAWEDEHLLVVDKPAGVVVHPGTGHQTGTLVHGLLALDAAGGDDDRPGIVHRLDRDTSGLLVVARSEEAHDRLQDLIRRREVERRYLALVKGRPRSRTGRIEAPIGRDRIDKTRHSLDTATPRNAVTHFEVLEWLGSRAYLEVTLETGRTHQIRVHLEALELLISGDSVYGSSGDLGLERQFLHAARLDFTHPFTGERVETESPLPDDLAGALERARGDT